mmetsp:Transcript_35060/g.41316  ORF Transcript_35060/g.41316 Transcript_35060/m.41316 type:complete len:118 (-) Transcript_35060:14-367(-)
MIKTPDRPKLNNAPETPLKDPHVAVVEDVDSFIDNTKCVLNLPVPHLHGEENEIPSSTLRNENPKFSWKPGSKVFINQGTKCVRGHRAIPYHGTIIEANDDDGTFFEPFKCRIVQLD